MTNTSVPVGGAKQSTQVRENMKNKTIQETMTLFMQLPDYLRQQVVRAMKRGAMPTPCAADVAELLRKVEDLDAVAHGDLLRECEEACRESEAYRAKAIRSNGRNKRMVLAATGLSPP